MDTTRRRRPPVSARQLRRSLKIGQTAFAWEWLKLDAKRRMVDSLSMLIAVPDGTQIRRTIRAGVPCVDITPTVADLDRCLLYLHGGGYAVGSAAGYRGFVADFARRLGCRAVAVEYGLAPEYAYPTALHQVRDVYLDLVASGLDGQRIVVVGDSAGGGLALALAMLLRDDHRPLPAALGLICPWLDLSADIEGRREEKTDPLISAALSHKWAPAYVGDADPRTPGISPLYGDLRGLPPMIVHSSGDDPLQVDSDQLVQKLEDVPDARVEYHRWAGQWHVFHLTAGVYDLAADALEQMAGWLRERFLSTTVST